jgi:hypothetical protein
MKLYGLGDTSDITTLSDSVLDAAYAASFAVDPYGQSTAAYGVEIVDRLASSTGFFVALFGHPFPLYAAIQASGKTTAGFIPSDAATTAVLDSSGNLITKAESVAASIGKWSIVGIVAAAALALALAFRKK